MSFDYGSKKPLWITNPEIAKAVKEGTENPSFESFRANVIHPVEYQEMTDRAGAGVHSRIRRYPNGELDYRWIVAHILELISELEFNQLLVPLDLALLTVVFPTEYRKMEPQQAEIMTRMSASEKARVRDMVEAAVKEQNNWNSGRGGGSVPGKHRTTS